MKNLFLFLALATFLVSCSIFSPKPESEPFYCKVNGKAWRPAKREPLSFIYNLKGDWYKKNGRFNILAVHYPALVGFSIKISEIKIGQYQLENDILKSRGFYSPSSEPNRVTLNSTKGILTITKCDETKVSGTFEFNVYDDLTKKEIKITKGQFNDLEYNTF